jgi:5-(carboxyamino)imidazole ribonucleotide synthase
VDVVTLENEFVDAAGLATLERAGVPVFPTSATVAIVQDKLSQKETLAAAGLPVPRFSSVTTPDDVAGAGGRFGWPVVLKARRDGYDGKGNATVRTMAGIESAWLQLGGDRGRSLYVEAFCPFVRELAIIVTRGRDRNVAVYPVVETVQRDHICHLVRAPAAIAPAVAERARSIALSAVEAVDGVGSFGVELFEVATGEIIINELAPRVHNSGHYTVEACVCSQFENHLRAVMGWPLGSTAMRAPAAVMANLLGATRGPGWPIGVPASLGVSAASVHLYGKAVSSPGRKMGHVTALGESLDEAEATAVRAAGALTFGGAT